MICEIYQPKSESVKNHIHIIGEIDESEYQIDLNSYTVYKTIYVFPDDEFINYRKIDDDSFFIEEKYIKRKISEDELPKYLI